MNIQEFFDPRTWTLSYVVWCEHSKKALVIDPVLDYDPIGSKIWTESVTQLCDFACEQKLSVEWILETHAHADHLSGSQQAKVCFPEAKLAVGERIVEVQQLFKNFFDLPDDFPTDGRQFDVLLKDNQTLKIGSLDLKVLFTPGHTPACVSYLIEDAVFTGDALFMPDMGTGRCDFPAGSAEDLYHSIHELLYSLADSTRVFVGHDYQPGGRPLAFQSTIGEEKRSNIQLNFNSSKDEFIEFREARDKTLQAPRLLYQSVQVNVDAGKLPKPHANQKMYFNYQLI
ncbi:MAG: MBL fold metallo-hydrolase [Myxococcales bacterium]|nr:MAG: MBL fold metallo-hydrolase [Myxococcales bacterium]